MPLLRTLRAIAVTGLILSGCSDAGSDSRAQVRAENVREVIGNLGGVPVRIPIEFAESVEYDYDPAILERPRQPASVRGFSSKLRSFGFEFRYPDMAGPGSADARKDRASHLPGNTSWIFVGLKAGQDYSGAGSVERTTSATLGRPEAITKASYQLVAEKNCGLDAYVLPGIDAASGKPNREHPNAADVFIGRDPAGKVTTFIECSNRPLDAAPCKQHFDLEPHMHAKVHLQFRRGLLCEWRGLQGAASKLISSFQSDRATK